MTNIYWVFHTKLLPCQLFCPPSSSVQYVCLARYATLLGVSSPEMNLSAYCKSSGIIYVARVKKENQTWISSTICLIIIFRWGKLGQLASSKIHYIDTHRSPQIIWNMCFLCKKVKVICLKVSIQ